jgi:hypothetical protein
MHFFFVFFFCAHCSFGRSLTQDVGVDVLVGLAAVVVVRLRLLRLLLVPAKATATATAQQRRATRTATVCPTNVRAHSVRNCDHAACVALQRVFTLSD